MVYNKCTCPKCLDNVGVRPTFFTIVTHVSISALACISVSSIFTCPAILTWVA